MDASGKMTIVADPTGRRSRNELRAYTIWRGLTEGRSNVFHWAVGVVTGSLRRLAPVAIYSMTFSKVFGVELTGDLKDAPWGQPRTDAAMEARYRR